MTSLPFDDPQKFISQHITPGITHPILHTSFHAYYVITVIPDIPSIIIKAAAGKPHGPGHTARPILVLCNNAGYTVFEVRGDEHGVDYT